MVKDGEDSNGLQNDELKLLELLNTRIQYLMLRNP